MEINLTPFMKITCMGAAGHLWGLATRTNPRLTLLVWLVAEAAVQIFRSQVRPLNRNEENMLMLLGALVTTACMAQSKLVTDIFTACLCTFAIALTSTVLNGIFNDFHTTYELRVRIRPLLDPTLIRL